MQYIQWRWTISEIVLVIPGALVKKWVHNTLVEGKACDLFSPQHDMHISKKVIKMAAPKDFGSIPTSLGHEHLNMSNFYEFWYVQFE